MLFKKVCAEGRPWIFVTVYHNPAPSYFTVLILEPDHFLSVADPSWVITCTKMLLSCLPGKGEAFVPVE